MDRQEIGGLTFVTDGHLGGYVEGGDPNTTYPILWDWLVEQNVRSVVDVGCGDGRGAAAWFASHGIEAVGVDGLATDTFEPNLILVRHDYTEGPFFLDEPVDLAWSAEFVEHVDERYVGNFLDTFVGARLILMTHALPGQAGYHHVNCQPPEYWIERVERIGYTLDLVLTDVCRQLAASEDIESDANYFAKTGMAFRKDHHPR